MAEIRRIPIEHFDVFRIRSGKLESVSKPELHKGFRQPRRLTYTVCHNSTFGCRSVALRRQGFETAFKWNSQSTDDVLISGFRYTP